MRMVLEIRILQLMRGLFLTYANTLN